MSKQKLFKMSKGCQKDKNTGRKTDRPRQTDRENYTLQLDRRNDIMAEWQNSRTAIFLPIVESSDVLKHKLVQIAMFVPIVFILPMFFRPQLV